MLVSVSRLHHAPQEQKTAEPGRVKVNLQHPLKGKAAVSKSKSKATVQIVTAHSDSESEEELAPRGDHLKGEAPRSCQSLRYGP
jgi:hypothetical protein